MDNILLTNIFTFFLAVLLATLEIQVEENHRSLQNKKISTYHLAMFVLVLLVFSLPYFSGRALSLENYAQTISLFFMFIVVWDFLWLVLNPKYPLKNFKKEHIWWHRSWIFGLPVDYYGCLAVSLVVLFPVIILTQATGLIHWWVTNLLLFLLETCGAVLFTLNILKIDNWHQKNSPFRSFRGR